MKMIGHGRERWEYLLRANFGGSDSGAISNGTSVETASSGSVQDGTLTVVDAATGQVEVLSNELKIDSTGVAWANTGVYGSSVSRARGLTLKADVKPNSTAVDFQFGLSANTAITLNYWGYHWIFNLSLNTVRSRVDDNAGTATSSHTVHGTSYTATYQPLAIVIGGYSSGVPWDGSSTGYSDGAAWFYNDGANWLLNYRLGDGSDSTLYLNATGSSTIAFMDNIKVPDADLSHLLKPLVLDTFTDTNGTALTSHTPDVDVVGGGWSALSGTWAIDSANQLKQTNIVDLVRNVCAIETGKSDVFVEAIITGPASGDFSTGLCVRASNDTNQWRIYLAKPASLFSIQQNVNGSVTTRASTSKTFANNTTYRVTCSANGTTMRAWLDDASELSYTSATFNQTETLHGFLEYQAGGANRYDNFAVYPIGNNGEYNALENY